MIVDKARGGTRMQLRLHNHILRYHQALSAALVMKQCCNIGRGFIVVQGLHNFRMWR